MQSPFAGSAPARTLGNALSARIAACWAGFSAQRTGRACVAIVGDSFVRGAGASRTSNGYAYLLRKMLDSVVLPLGSGGTGFIIGCGDGRHYHGRMRQMAISQPNLVVIQTTCNDLHYPNAEVGAAVADYIHIVRRLPSAPRVVLLEAMFCPDIEQLARIRGIVSGVAGELGVDFIGTSGWIDAHPHLMAADQVHPSDEGHRVIAGHLEGPLSAAITHWRGSLSSSGAIQGPR
jgi:lysophospholipase L1-like esterase